MNITEIEAALAQPYLPGLSDANPIRSWLRYLLDDNERLRHEIQRAGVVLDQGGKSLAVEILQAALRGEGK